MVKAIDGANSSPIYQSPQQAELDRTHEERQNHLKDLYKAENEIIATTKKSHNQFNQMQDQFIRLAEIMEDFVKSTDENIASNTNLINRNTNLVNNNNLIIDDLINKLDKDHEEHVKYMEDSQRKHIETQQFIERSQQEGIETDKKLEKIKAQHVLVIHIKKEKQHRERNDKEIISEASPPIQISFCARLWNWVKSFWK